MCFFVCVSVFVMRVCWCVWVCVCVCVCECLRVCVHVYVYMHLYVCINVYVYKYLCKYTSALQPGRIIRVNWVTFCLGQPSLTHFIKYPGLTRILHRITYINNDVSRWRCPGQCQYIMSIHFEKNHCWWRESTKKSNKIWVQVACTVTALAVIRIARPYDTPGAYQCSIVPTLIIGTSISAGCIIWLGYARL